MKYFSKKIISLTVALLLVSLAVFLAFSVLPADASIAKLGSEATPERIAALRTQLGLDKPFLTRYFSWLRGAIRLDFGESFQYTGVTVVSLLKTRIGTSALLAVISFLMIVAFSLPLGIFSAKRRSTAGRSTMMVVSQITMGVPSFFLGVLITYVFSLVLKWFHIGDYVSPSDNFWKSAGYLVFPASAIALPKIAMTERFLTASIRTELHKDYVRTAYAKGCSRNEVFYGHVLKNSLVPAITFLGIIIAEVVAGSIVVEQVFGVPGIGTLLITAISNRDYPVVEAVVLLIAFVIMVINFLVDAIYKIVDPRVEI